MSYFNTVCDEAPTGEGVLSGYKISVKDCICVKGVGSTAGSAILKGYLPLFDATAVEKIKNAGGRIIGKTSQDEFGFGSFNVNVGLGFETPVNPHDPERVCGGSSGGAAAATALLDKHIALAESTGGSIAAPASFCGVVGLTPTYGLVSRYGLLDYANSLDKIGTMAKTVKEAALLLSVVAGHDVEDSTSANHAPEKYENYAGESVSGMKIAVLKESYMDGVAPEVQAAVKNAVAILESKGCVVEEIELTTTMKYGIPAYYIIATSEASTNLAKYCGMRYGVTEKLAGDFNKYFSRVRSSHFGLEAKRRIMLGTFARMAGYRDAYYVKATKVRAKIIAEYKDAFEKFDAIISPVMPFVAPLISDVKKLTPVQNYLADVLTVGPNLAGMPHISINCGHSGKMPIGLMITADHFNERAIIKLGSVIHQ